MSNNIEQELSISIDSSKSSTLAIEPILPEEETPTETGAKKSDLTESALKSGDLVDPSTARKDPPGTPSTGSDNDLEINRDSEPTAETAGGSNKSDSIKFGPGEPQFSYKYDRSSYNAPQGSANWKPRKKFQEEEPEFSYKRSR